MRETDVAQIVIGGRKIGIVGLAAAIEDIARDHAGKNDDEVRAALMKRLREKNYIPARAEEAYGDAFVREFKRSLGQAFEEEPGTGILEVKILGAGCARCDWLRQAVIDAASELNLAVDVEHVTDPRRCAEYRVFGYPALVVGGRVRSAGTVPAKESIRKWLSGEVSPPGEK